MQQRAVVPSVSHFEPIVEPFARALRACLQQFPAATWPAQIADEAVENFRRRLERGNETEPSSATQYQLSVAATLAVVRAAKQQRGLPETGNSLSAEEQHERWAQLQKGLASLPIARRRVVALQLIGLTPADCQALLNIDAAKIRRETERGWQTLQSKWPDADSEMSDLATVYQTQPTRAELHRADCLADEFLTRACTGDISESDRFFVADHLVTCKDCAEEFQLALRLKGWPEANTNLREENASAPLDEAATEIETATERTPKWWQALIPRFVHYTGFNLFTAGLTGFFFITTLSLATWLVAQHFKHKVELAQVKQQQAIAEILTPAEPATPETLQARVEEAQKQLADLQTAITEQNADKVLSNQELLGIQNNTLQKELEDLSKPQLDAPVVEIDLATLRKTAEAGKEIVTAIEVPNTSAVFTVILHKPADKIAATYLLELFDAKRTKPLWSAQKKLETQTKIAITLAKRNYPAGKYRFTLSSVEGKKKELLETYQLDVKYQPPPKAAKKKR